MMKAPREDMIVAFRSLYPFPEYQATCRGDDEEVDLYMIEENQEFHSRYDNGDLYFKAKRGFLDYLLISTWENRFDYGLNLFRIDRRPIIDHAKNIIPYVAYYTEPPVGIIQETSSSFTWEDDFEMIKTTSNFLFSFRPVSVSNLFLFLFPFFFTDKSCVFFVSFSSFFNVIQCLLYIILKSINLYILSIYMRRLVIPLKLALQLVQMPL